MLTASDNPRASHSPFSATLSPFDVDGGGDESDGTCFGHFAIEKEIGRGGMGVVYRAREYASNRIVALKMMHFMHLQAPDMLRRFDAEVHAVATLDHPHIMPVYEVGQCDGIPFFSMKFAEHGSLAGKAPAYAGRLGDIAALIIKLSRAVFHAHQRGVIHRDLKPGNILLDADDEPYVADFGLAKIIDARNAIDATTVALGTPSYLAPELARGVSGEITTAVDIYGLGAIFYELLTGRPPACGASSAEVLAQLAKGPPPAPHELDSAIDHDISAVCMKCLSPLPGDRYATADDLAVDLENWLCNRPVQARPPGVVGQFSRWCRRQPVVASLLGGMLLLLILIGVGSTTAAIIIGEQRDRARHAELAAQEELYNSLLAQSRLGRQTGYAGHRFKGLQSLAQAARIRVTPEVRNEVAALLALTDMRPQRAIPVRLEQNQAIAFDPDLARYLTVTADRQLSLRRLSDNKELARYPGTGTSVLSIAAFSEDGRYTASRHYDGAIRVWDTRENRLAFELANRVARHRPYMSTRIWFGCVFSRDSRTLAVELPDGGCTLHDIAAGGRETARFPGEPGPLALAFDPSGTRLAIANRETGVARILDTRTGQALRTFNHPENVVTLEWNPDGSLLAVSSLDASIHLWNTASGELHRVLTGHRLYAVQITFSPDGKLLASTSFDTAIMLWDPEAGDRLVTLPGHGSEPVMRFSRDGKHLITGDFKPDATIFEIVTGDDICRTFTPKGKGNVAVVTAGIDISPDSRWLASVTRKTIWLWDLANSRLAASIELDTPTETSALFTPDGKRLLVASREIGLRTYPFNARATDNPLGQPDTLTPEKGYTLSDFGAGATHALLTNRRYGKVILWPLDPAAGEPRRFDVQKEAWDAALSPDGKLLATSCAAQGDLPDLRLAHLWDARTGEKLRVINGGAGGQVRFTPDGTRLLTSSPTRGFAIWDIATWMPAHNTVISDTLFTFALSRDGRYLCAPAQGEIWLYQGNGYAQPVIQLSTPSDTSLSPRAVFSHDASLLAIHEADGIVHLWNLKNLRAKLAEYSLDWSGP